MSLLYLKLKTPCEIIRLCLDHIFIYQLRNWILFASVLCRISNIFWTALRAELTTLCKLPQPHPLQTVLEYLCTFEQNLFSLSFSLPQLLHFNFTKPVTYLSPHQYYILSAFIRSINSALLWFRTIGMECWNDIFLGLIFLYHLILLWDWISPLFNSNLYFFHKGLLFHHSSDSGANH